MFKESFYNYYISRGEEILFFNSITCATLLMTKEENEKIQYLISDPLGFEIEYPTVFGQFVEWGFLFDDSKDEIDTIRYRHRLSTIDSKDYFLSINSVVKQDEVDLFLRGNNAEHHIPVGNMSSEVINRITKHITYMIEEKRITKLILSWLGNDSLLYFDTIIHPISLHAKELCSKHNISFNNRAFTDVHNIQETELNRMNQIDLNNFQIVVDSKIELKNNNVLDTIYRELQRKVTVLCDALRDTTILIYINYDSKTQNERNIKSIFNELDDKYKAHIQINYRGIDSSNNYDTCKKEKNNKLECSADEVFRIGITSRCNADRMYHLVINHDGKIFSCPSAKYLEQYILGELSDSGEIIYNQDRIERKLAKASFENEKCLSCKHLPICLGPCSQKMITAHKDNLKNICTIDLVKIDPEAFILDYYNKQFKE